MSAIQPKIKSTTRLLRLENCLYLGSSGQSAEIPDPTGTIEYLLQAMDGKSTLPQLHQVVVQKYPTISLEDVAGAVEQLDHAGLLENGAFNSVGSSLTEYDLKRWERNINFFGSFSDLHTNKYEAQNRLKTARVALLGLGGLGSHLLYDLVALGVHTIRAVDFDTIELSNLNRQILYTELDIGKSKTEAARERILGFNPHLNLDIIRKN